MFNKKQQNNFTKLYIRISSLFNAINTNKCDIYSSTKTISFNTNELLDNKTFSFTFQSENGPIEFSIKSSGEEYKNYSLSYINKQTKWMFEIYCRTDFTVVQPTLGDKIFAKDIDLAILEIENFVEDIRVKNISNYNYHIQELQKLERLEF